MWQSNQQSVSGFRRGSHYADKYNTYSHLSMHLSRPTPLQNLRGLTFFIALLIFRSPSHFSLCAHMTVALRAVKNILFLFLRVFHWQHTQPDVSLGLYFQNKMSWTLSHLGKQDSSGFCVCYKKKGDLADCFTVAKFSFKSTLPLTLHHSGEAECQAKFLSTLALEQSGPAGTPQ